MKRLLLASLLPMLLMAGCATRPPCDTVYQTSTIDALLAGLYDGDVGLEELGLHGNFGIGTYNGLDGEMILYDDEFYQVRADGKVYRPDPRTDTPFATVCAFEDELSFELQPGSDYKSVERQIDMQSPNQNIFNAIMIEGEFDFVKTRSVPRQRRPYPPLKEVAQHQPQFMLEDVEGVIVGFRSPPFVKGLNVPGYHLHFLSADRTAGGHILDFKLRRATCRLDRINKLQLELPLDSIEFGKTDLSRDRSADLHKVEKDGY